MVQCPWCPCTECCEAFTDQEDLLRLSLKCLQGMLFESVPNRVRVIEMGGITVLSKVRGVKVLTVICTAVLASNVFLLFCCCLQLRETEALSCLHEAVDFVLANIMGDVWSVKECGRGPGALKG